MSVINWWARKVCSFEPDEFMLVLLQFLTSLSSCESVCVVTHVKNKASSTVSSCWPAHHHCNHQVVVLLGWKRLKIQLSIWHIYGFRGSSDVNSAQSHLSQLDFRSIFFNWASQRSREICSHENRSSIVMWAAVALCLSQCIWTHHF